MLDIDLRLADGDGMTRSLPIAGICIIIR